MSHLRPNHREQNAFHNTLCPKGVRERAKRLGRPITPLDLSAEERAYWERQARRHRVPRSFSDRCRMILRCADGLSSKAVGAELGGHEHTVGKWCRRFLKDPIEGLDDGVRPGRPRTIEDDQVAEVIERTLATTPKDATHWSIRSMAKKTGLSHTTIRRIWAAFGLQPHRSETFKLSSDGRVPEDLDVHIVMDNGATHKTPMIRAWPARRPRYHVHFTPTSASWINQVERWFSELTRKKIQRGIHRSVRQLETDIKAFIDARNEDPKPYRWVTSADKILAAVKRFCQKAKAT